MNDPQTPRRYKRKNRLPDPKFQLRWIGTILGYCALALIVQTLVVGAQVAQSAEDFAQAEANLLQLINGILIRSFLMAAVLVLPCLALMALKRTFVTAGPLYRFEQHLKQVAAGEWPGECRIREGDEHQNLCALINAALESARAMEPLESSTVDEDREEQAQEGPRLAA